MKTMHHEQTGQEVYFCDGSLRWRCSDSGTFTSQPGFECDTCAMVRPWAEGADDDRPDTCDRCCP
jgi:hypothetical protein